jgi:hypothetical protein
MTSAEPSAHADSGILGPRVTGHLLDRLAVRAATAGPRELDDVVMILASQALSVSGRPADGAG